MLFADLNLARRLESADAAKHIAYAEARANCSARDCALWTDRRRLCRLAGRTTRTAASWGWGWTGPVSEADFERAEHSIGSTARTRVQPCPLADPKLLEHLNRRGYQVEMSCTSGSPLVPGETFPAPSFGIVVRAIQPKEADLWTLVAFRAPGQR